MLLEFLHDPVVRIGGRAGDPASRAGAGRAAPVSGYEVGRLLRGGRVRHGGAGGAARVPLPPGAPSCGCRNKVKYYYFFF